MRHENKIIVLSILIFLASCIFFYSFYLATYINSSELTEEQKEEIQNEVNEIVTYYKNESSPSIDVTQKAVFPGEGVPLTGEIIVSAFENDTGEYTRLYGLDVTSESEDFTILKPDWNSFNALARFTDGSKNGDFFFTYAGVGEAPNINLYDADTATQKVLSYTAGENERNMSWSNRLQYLAFNKVNSDPSVYSNLLSLSSWDMVVVDVANENEVVNLRGAFQPKWVGDTNFLVYLRTDGLYSYNVATKEETKVLGLESETGLAAATSMIDVSPNGQYLIWSTAKRGTMTFFAISTATDQVTLTAIDQIITEGVEYYWPIFSFDNYHYAVQAIDEFNEVTNARENPRLEIRNLASTDIQYSVSLEEFNFNALFLDDWVQ